MSQNEVRQLIMIFNIFCDTINIIIIITIITIFTV